MLGSEFAEAVEKWAADRNLIEGSSPQAQVTKLLEEMTELYDAIRLAKKDEITDGIGDCEVVLRVIECQLGLKFREMESSEGQDFGVLLCALGRLVGRVCKGGSVTMVSMAIMDARRNLASLAEAHGLTIAECRAHAWNEIKDRKGRMVDGIYIREKDSNAELMA